MPSPEGKLLTEFMYRFSNFNPVENPDVIGKFRKLNRIVVKNAYCPKGFILSRESTASGTRYERITKAGADRNHKLILYFHGGAYQAGLLYFYKDFAPDFYRESGGAEIIYLDYRLAPEFQYPVQLREALDLWDNITQNQNYQPENIIIGGDSAGGNLVLAMMLWLRDHHQKLPKAAFCISPWADMTGSSTSARSNYGKDVEFGQPGKIMTEEISKILHDSEIYAWLSEKDRKENRQNPYISPVFGNYQNFPPMLFTAGRDEMLLGDTLTLVRKFKNLGIPVRCDIQPGMCHIYPVFRHFSPESSHSYWCILNFIRRIFEL
ncbi:MAG: alpha/beta hydrolase [Oscillospiraceae bacterium]|nr:alpha/beta hydrolase [Oscillospiraceae bacterium]